MVLAPLQDQTSITVASGLQLKPPVILKIHGLNNIIDFVRNNNVNGALEYFAVIGSTNGLYGYLFDIGFKLGPLYSDMLYPMLDLFSASRVQQLFGYDPILISPDNDISIVLASISYDSITKDSVLAVEIGKDYLAVRFNGSELLRTSLPREYIIDQIITYAGHVDAQGSPVSGTALAFIDYEAMVDITQYLPIIVSVAVVAAVVGTVVSLMTKLVK